MPYGVVLKDERPTSNHAKAWFFSAVLILVTKILINSSVFCKISFFMIRTE